jgi:hypothetical protein
MANVPLGGTGWPPYAADLLGKKSGKFSRRGLDHPNQVEIVARNRLRNNPKSRPAGRKFIRSR